MRFAFRAHAAARHRDKSHKHKHTPGPDRQDIVLARFIHREGLVELASATSIVLGQGLEFLLPRARLIQPHPARGHTLITPSV